LLATDSPGGRTAAYIRRPKGAGNVVRAGLERFCDRDAKYPALFDEALADAGIAVVLTGTRIPRMNAVMER
jgi:hypothetical protein